MAHITIIDPETMKKIGDGEGDVNCAVVVPEQIVQTLEERKKTETISDLSHITDVKPYELTGSATTHISRKKWQRLQRRFGLKKERQPRKWKKAAKRVHMEVMPMASRITNQAEVIANPHADVNVQFEVDYRIKVEGRRTRMTERIAARARYLLSESHRREVEKFMASVRERIKPGMLEYED